MSADTDGVVHFRMLTGKNATFEAQIVPPP